MVEVRVCGVWKELGVLSFKIKMKELTNRGKNEGKKEGSSG